MKIPWLSLISSVVALSFSPSAKAAAIYTNFAPDGSCAVTFYGDIKTGDDNVFDALTPDCKGGGVLLKSKGGSLEAGLRIGELIRQKRMETAVAFDARCASACALAWLGGVRRHMAASSRIGFHAAYVMQGDLAFESGVGNALIGAYLTSMGLPKKAVIFITSAKPEGMNWLDYKEAASLSIAAQLLTERDRAWIEKLDTNAIPAD